MRRRRVQQRRRAHALPRLARRRGRRDRRRRTTAARGPEIETRDGVHACSRVPRQRGLRRRLQPRRRARPTQTSSSSSTPTRSRGRAPSPRSPRARGRGRRRRAGAAAAARPSRAAELERQRAARQRPRWPGGYGEPARGARRAADDRVRERGRRFAVRADLFRELGGFTEELFLYQEDLELCWRVRLRGLRVVLEPGADVLHDYVLERPDRRKEYYLERNRLDLRAHGVLGAAARPARAGAARGRGRRHARRAARRAGCARRLRGWALARAQRGWLASHRRDTQALRRVHRPRARTLPDAACSIRGCSPAAGRRRTERAPSPPGGGRARLPLTLRSGA